MRRRQLQWLWARTNKLNAMDLTRDALLKKLGAAQTKTAAARRLNEDDDAKDGASYTYRLDRDRLRQVRRREGRYLLRTNLTATDPAQLWQLDLQLVEDEAAFKTLKGDLANRRSTTRKSGASKRTTISRSSPTACTTPSASN